MPGYELIGDEELLEIKEIFDKSKIFFRHGFEGLRNGIYKVREFENSFANYFGQSDALAVTSGTAALKVALEAFSLPKKSQVLIPSFTFVATAEAVIEAGLQPVVVDIDLSLNLDPYDLEMKITPSTKAIIVVHMLGVPAKMNEIINIAKKYGLIVIEDTAWGCGGKYKNQFLGTIGDAGTFSFDFAKILTTGEGGMIFIKDKTKFEKAKAYHDHGHENNPKLPRWEDSRSTSGFNYRMMELQGAIGIAQLKKLPIVIEKQRENKKKLESIILKYKNLRLREIPEGSEETADAMIFFVQTPEIAIKCRNKLLEKGFGTKILPEAISWHFAGTWDHMQEIVDYHGKNLMNSFSKSLNILNKSVALPVNVNMKDEVFVKVDSALRELF